MRVLLVEDNYPLADVIRRALQKSGHLIDWAQNGQEVEDWLAFQCYDIVLLDLGLPDIDGATVLKRMRASGKPVPVLVLSAREMVDERVRLLDLGADDYVVKPIALSELEARIRSLVRRSHGLTGSQITHGNLCLDISARIASIKGKPLDLSARELAALEYMMVRAQRIVTKEHLLEALYGWQNDGNSINAIEKVISRLRSKLAGAGVRISTVRGLGYSLDVYEA